MSKATRKAFGETLVELGKEFSHIVALDADLAKSTQSQMFAAEFPDRFFEMGISEANMIGVGAGLALSGKSPFICSFAAFVTGRFDQIRMSVSYQQAPVRIVGTHAGVGIGEDGHSQMGLEDLACMRTLPNMLVLQPADDVETAAMMRELIDRKEPAYLRLTRQNVPRVHSKDHAFAIGKFPVLREGKDALVLATGGVVHESLAAAEELAKQGMDVAVANASSIKPLDEAYLKEAARKYPKFITVEDHYITGGLGGAVSEFFAELGNVGPVKRIGVEKFGQSGTPENLYDHYGLNAKRLTESFQAWLR